MTTLLESLHAMLHLKQGFGALQYFIIGFCIKDTSLTFLSIYISNYISGRLNPLQQELQINSQSPYFAVPSPIHQVSPTTWSAVSRRQQRLKRSGQAGCASGGRSGREGVRSAGNSGDLPHRSIPSYSPAQHKAGTWLRHVY